jgi:hypothetical protein
MNKISIFNFGFCFAKKSFKAESLLVSICIGKDIRKGECYCTSKAREHDHVHLWPGYHFD